jgi:hypothetical protein
MPASLQSNPFGAPAGGAVAVALERTAGGARFWPAECSVMSGIVLRLFRTTFFAHESSPLSS